MYIYILLNASLFDFSNVRFVGEPAIPTLSIEKLLTLGYCRSHPR